jgi:hypothetical protein
MNKRILLFAGAAVLFGGGLFLGTRMNSPAPAAEGRGAIGVMPSPTSESDPFTHVASIPATVDPSTIRFEKLKAVTLATKTETTKAADCDQRQFREPDGSNCETVKVLERAKAIQANYSFIGPQTSADGETGPTRQGFSVYFRPDELPLNAPAEKLNREQAESLFQISTSRPMVQQKVLDKQASHLCDGHYADGSWVPNDPKCQDQPQYTTQTVPSAYWAVTVDVRHPASMATH